MSGHWHSGESEPSWRQKRSMTRSAPAIVLAIVCLAALIPPPSQAAAQPPNVLWITIDDLRPDALSCYGAPWAKTPNIDRIAARGVRFRHAYAQSVICRPSRLSTLTGQYCHVLRDMGMGPAADEPPRYYRDAAPVSRIDLRAALARVGMRPSHVGKTHWEERWDIVPHAEPERADWMEMDPAERVYGLVHLVAPQSYPPRIVQTSRVWAIGGGNPLPYGQTEPGVVTDAALAQLETSMAGGGPFFLRVSYTAPHVPILSPPEFMVNPDSVGMIFPTIAEIASKPDFERLQLAQYASVRHLTRDEMGLARGSYFGLVSFVDFQVGRILQLLEERGELDNTLIAINSDHGLQLGEHALHKKRNFYEQTAAVPLILSWPAALPQNTVIDELVELVDFLPTVLHLLGVGFPDGIAGRSLVPLMRGEVKRWRPAVFSEIDHSMSLYTALRVCSGRRLMVRTKDWKMIYFRDARLPREDGALYYLKEDPHETRNLYGEKSLAEIVSVLKRSVDAWDAGEQFSAP